MANPKELLQLEQSRKTTLAEIYGLQTKILALEKENTKEVLAQSDSYKKLKTDLGLSRKELSITSTQIKKINSETSELAKGFSTIAGSISSLSELQEEFKKGLVNTATKAFDLGKTIGESGEANNDKYSQALKLSADLIDINARLGALTKEDVLEKIALQQEYAEKFDTIKEISSKLLISSKQLAEVEKDRAETLASITKEIEKAHGEAEKHANVDKEQSEFLKELNEDYHKIGKTFKKIGYTAEIIFGSKRGFLGMALIGAGMLAEKFHEVGREMGYSLTQAKGFKSQILIAGLLSEESAEAVKELGKDLGDTSHISAGMATDAALLAYNYKLSGEQAAYLSTAFGELQGQSWDTGQNTLKYVSALAAANGVMPGEAMKDIAENSEFMAKFTQEGGKNIGEAAVAAAKLGVGLGTAEKMADHLLDYQTSVSDEMEASVLLGRDLNLGKARELAYNGKIAESMEAGLEAIGGISEYNKMDYYQRQAVAKALGVSNAEMQKMVAHEETLKGMHGVAAQQYERISTLMHTIGDSIAGKALKGMGGLVLSGAQFGAHLSQMGIKIPMLTNLMTGFSKITNGIISGLGSMVSWIGKAIAKMLGLKAAQSAVDGAGSMAGPLTKAGLPDKRFKANKPTMATPPEKPISADPAGQSNKFGKINGAQLIQAAVALLILAAALFVFAKAAQEFGGKIDWGNVFVGIIALGVLGLVAAGLAAIGVPLIAGAFAMLIAAGAFYVFGLAAQQVAIGIGMFGDALKKVDIGQMALFGLALIPLGIGMATFGLMAPWILLGSIALLALGGAMALLGPSMLNFSASMATLDVGKLALFGLALIPLGIGLALFGALSTPIMMGALALLVFGTALGVMIAGAGAMGATLGGIQTYVTGLIAIVPQILSLALAFSALALSLAMIGQMGIAALPVLAGLAIGGGILMALMGGGSGAGGGKEDTSTKLLEEIQGLRQDMSDGKIGVYIDGKKMNTGLAISNKRQPT